MLYDTRWDQKTETNANPFTLGSLIAWLEKQPDNREYYWGSVDGDCLIGLYSTACRVSFFECHSAFHEQNITTLVACPKPWTFGAALNRARKIALNCS